MVEKPAFNSAFLPDGLYPSKEMVEIAKEILGVCGSCDDRRVRHETTPQKLGKQLELLKKWLSQRGAS